jgi:hypothetical protein
MVGNSASYFRSDEYGSPPDYRISPSRIFAASTVALGIYTNSDYRISPSRIIAASTVALGIYTNSDYRISPSRIFAASTVALGIYTNSDYRISPSRIFAACTVALGTVITEYSRREYLLLLLLLQEYIRRVIPGDKTNFLHLRSKKQIKISYGEKYSSTFFDTRGYP